MNVQTYLYFDGNCREALELYKRVFGVSVEYLSTYGEGSAEFMPHGWSDKIYHTTVKFGDSTLNMSDAALDEQIEFGGFALLAHVESAAEARRVFAVLEEDGVVRMPLQSTIWASDYGIVTDRFGVTWKIQA